LRAWVYYHSLTVPGGGERHVLATLEVLRGLGYEPVLVTCGYDPRVPRLLGEPQAPEVQDLCPGATGLTARRLARLAATLLLHEPPGPGPVIAFQGLFSYYSLRAARRGILYSLSPPRALWDPGTARLQGGLSAAAAGPAGAPLRLADRLVSRRYRVYLANSLNVAGRVRRAYGVRGVQVLYPPVRVYKYRPGPLGDYYLLVSRLEPHKRVHVVMEAFRAAGERLLVVGDGPLRGWAERFIARHGARNIELLGRVPEDELITLYSRARAVVYMPVNEDFGLVPLEAAASGKATIAAPEGGLLETVVHGETGYFVEPRPGPLARLVKSLTDEELKAMAPRARRWAQRFDISAYRRGLARALAVLEES